MFFRHISTPHLWGVLSRTRPLTPSPKRPAVRTRKKLCGSFNCGFWYFVYQGLGVTAPFGLCYVVGIVVEETGGNGVTSAIFVAMVTSLLTGLCFSEFISANRRCCGNASTAVYQLVGEFPSFLISVLSVFVSCSCFAAMSKALSSTMEVLSHERLSIFLANNIGTLPISNLPPDMLAFGAALVTSVLLACGLKQAGVLRTAMNILCLVGFIFFLVVGGSHTTTDNSRVEKRESGSQQILIGAAISCCLFYQFLELGRRSKDLSQSNVTLPLGVTLTSVGVLVTSLSIGVVLSFMIDNSSPIYGAPLLHAFQLRDVAWARLLMGSIQVIVLGLGMSECGEFVCRTLVTMSSEGFIPSFLSLECPFAFSYSRAHLVGGISASFMALFFTHIYLLQVMAGNILLTNIVITTITLYRPFRCSYDSLCTVAVTPSSRPGRRLSPSSHLKSKAGININPERTLHFLKTGIGVLAFKRNERKDGDDELSIPLLSSLHSTSAMDNEALFDELAGSDISPLDSSDVPLVSPSPDHTDRKVGENENDKSDASSKDNVKKTLDLESNDSELISLNESRSSTDEFEVETREPEEFDVEEDIDTIVSEYKEQLRISRSGTKLRRYPTKETARRAFLLILSKIILVFILFNFSLRYKRGEDLWPESTSIFKGTFIFINLFLILLVLYSLLKLPKVTPLSSLSRTGLRNPGSILMSIVSLSMNILLFSEISLQVFWTLIPVYILAVILYIIYSSHHSVVATSSSLRSVKGTSEKIKEREMVCLSAGLPTSFYASKPQQEELL